MGTTMTIQTMKMPRRKRRKLCFGDVSTAGSIRTADLVYDQNREGIAAFQEGSFKAASGIFTQALRVIQDQNDNIAVPHKTKTSSTMDYPQRHRRHEHNEGMFLFREPLDLYPWYEHEETESTLIYNQALVLVQRHEYASAAPLLQKSVDVLGGDISTCAELSFKAMHNIGYVKHCLGDTEESMRWYTRSAKMAATVGDIFVALSLNCMGVLCCHQHDPTSAIRCLRKSFSLTQGGETDESTLTKDAATILNNLGSAYYLQGSYKEALDHHERALKLRRKIFGNQSSEAATCAFNVALTHQQLGHLREASTLYQEFINITEAGKEPNHHDIVIACMRLEEVHRSAKDPQNVLLWLNRALKACRSFPGNNHSQVASCLSRIGNFHCETHNYAAAIEAFGESLTTEKAAPSPDPRRIMAALFNIAQLQKHTMQYERALESFKEGLVAHAETGDALEGHALSALQCVALIEYQLHKYEDSFDTYQELLRVCRDYYEDDYHQDIATTLNSIGLVSFKLDNKKLAMNCIGRSLAILRKILEPDCREIGVLWYNLATVAFENGDSEGAMRCYEESLRIERKILGEDHPDHAMSLMHMGQRYHSLGDADKGMAKFAEALESELRRPNANVIFIAKIKNHIGNMWLERGNIDSCMKCFVDAARFFESKGYGNSLVITGLDFYGLSKIHPATASQA